MDRIWLPWKAPWPGATSDLKFSIPRSCHGNRNGANENTKPIPSIHSVPPKKRIHPGRIARRRHHHGPSLGGHAAGDPVRPAKHLHHPGRPNPGGANQPRPANRLDSKYHRAGAPHQIGSGTESIGHGIQCNPTLGHAIGQQSGHPPGTHGDFATLGGHFGGHDELLEASGRGECACASIAHLASRRGCRQLHLF